MTDPLQVRPMAAADTPAVVAIHLAAFPGFFLTFLGPRFLRLLYAEAVACGEIALVAESAGRPVGFVMGSAQPGGFYGQLVRRRLVGFALAALPAVARRPGIALRVARALRRPAEGRKPEGTATLMSLGVDPATQGLGAGRALVQAFLAEAGRRGARKVDLTTDQAGNERTNRFYAALGFRVARTIVTPEQRILNEYEIDLPLR